MDVTSPASRQWRDLAPELHPEPYVFAVEDAIPAGLSPFAVIRINSELSAVGLTAAVSRVLADTGISCNVIAGAAHDHLFTAWDRRDEALTLISAL